MPWIDRSKLGIFLQTNLVRRFPRTGSHHRRLHLHELAPKSGVAIGKVGRFEQFPKLGRRGQDIARCESDGARQIGQPVQFIANRFERVGEVTFDIKDSAIDQPIVSVSRPKDRGFVKKLDFANPLDEFLCKAMPRGQRQGPLEAA